MSSAFLLVAIVAIWACALVPHWVHRSHEHAPELDMPGDEPEHDETEPEYSGPGYDTLAYGDRGYQDAEHEETEYHQPAHSADVVAMDDVSEAAPGVPAADAGPAWGGFVPHQHVGPGHHARPGEHAWPGILLGHLDYVDAAEFRPAQSPMSARPASAGLPHAHPAAPQPAAPGAVPPQQARPQQARPQTARSSQAPSAPVRTRSPLPATGRSRALRARRRTLALLALLFLAPAAGTVVGIVAWWVMIAPALMLVFYLMLLRAAVQVQRENAASRAEAEARVAAAARAEAQAAAAAAPPDADVIQISGHSAPGEPGQNEPCDQYDDTAPRAVGE